METEPKNALILGRAAEHLVVADLLLSGYQAFLTEQGMPYDVVIDHEGTLVRVQVKSTIKPFDVNWGRQSPRIAYNWCVRRRGDQGVKRLENRDCDLVALVAIDIKAIAYLPVQLCGQNVQLRRPGEELRIDLRSGSQWNRTVDQFPISDALSGDPSIYRVVNRGRSHCLRGHEFTSDNTIISSNGSRRCRECKRTDSREHMRSVRAAALEQSHAA